MVGARALLVGTLLAATACTPERRAEDPDWYSSAQDLDVEEPIAFTDVDYAFPEQGPGYGDLELPPEFTTWFAPDDPAPPGCSDWVEDDSGMLPIELKGMVTVHPRVYFKVNGCTPGTGNLFDIGRATLAAFDFH